MNGPLDDETIRQAYRESRRATGGSADVGVEELRALVEGAVSPAEREALLARILADPDATRELGLLQAVGSAADSVAGSATQSEAGVSASDGVVPLRRPRLAWAAGTLAAAAVLAFVLLPVGARFLRAPEPTYRSAGDASAPVLVAPPPGVAAKGSSLFQWTAVPDAERYVLEVVAGNGDALVQVETRDTVTPLPAAINADSLARATGWWVIAHLRNGDQRRSALRLFNAR